MRRSRPIAAAVSAALLIGAMATGVVLGAVQRATLTVQAAPAGTTVTLNVETTTRLDGSRPGTLVIVPAHALDISPSGLDCDEIAGSVALGEMSWHTAAVAFGEGVYDGFVGTATFTVPAVPPGQYYLGETIAVLGNRCHTFAAFEVSTGQLPDTAMTVVPPG